MAAKIPIDPQRLAELCRQHHIRWLALFGSVLRNDFGPASDVDVLAEFAPDHIPGLAFFLSEEVSQLLGRRVDLNTPGFLAPTSFPAYWPRRRIGWAGGPYRPYWGHPWER